MNNLQDVSIRNFLDKNNVDYAIMINGDWGSGKTYYIKNVLMPSYSNSIYMSMYGISNIDEIKEKIYYGIIRNKKDNNKKLKKVCNFFKNNRIASLVIFPFKIVYKFLKWLVLKLRKLLWIITHNIVKIGVDLSLIAKKDIIGIINLFDKIDDYILIIDDLERCSLNIEEILGYFNDLVEHKKVKCIIIANENEISRINNSNFELKIMTAISEKIDFTNVDSKNKNSYQLTNQQNNKEINYDDIKKRIDYLYKDVNKYKNIKEKLIGKTFCYEPNIEEILDNLLKDYKIQNKDFYNIINNNKSVIIDSMNINNCYNLRTLKSIIQNYYEIYIKSYVHINKNFKSKKNLLYLLFLNNVCFSTIGFKNGINILDLLKGAMSTTVTLNGDNASMNSYYVSFNFIDKYIVESVFDNDMMKKTIEYYVSIKYEMIPADDPYKVIEIFWEKDDEELSSALTKLNDNINSYNYRMYPKIISKISHLEQINFEPSKTKKIINSIEDYFKENSIEYVDFHSFLDDEKVLKIYNSHVDRIRSIIKNNEKNKYNDDFSIILDSKNWGIELLDYVRDNKDRFLNEKSFLSKIDVEKITNCISNSNNINIYSFKYSIDSIYGFGNIRDYYKDDFDSIVLLSNNLHSILKDKKYGIMKLDAINVLVTTIDKKKELLSDKDMKGKI